jgi:hypothetical protein
MLTERDDEGEREHGAACGKGRRDAVGEQVLCVQCARAGRGENGDQDAEAEGAAELMGDVDQPGRRANVLGVDAGYACGGGRAEGGALAGADEDH